MYTIYTFRILSLSFVPSSFFVDSPDFLAQLTEPEASLMFFDVDGVSNAEHNHC